MLKEIPGTLGFLASDTGEIYDGIGNLRNQYRNLDGYCTVTVLHEDERWVTYGVHRLVALAFLEPPADPMTLTVNHKDTDKTNNCVSNLEWVTTRLNNVHSALNRPPTRPMILMWQADESKSILSESLVTAGALAGCSPDEVWQAIVDDATVNGWSFRHQRSKDPVPPHLRKSTIPVRDSLGRLPEKATKLRDIFTGEVTVYPTMTEAASAHGVLTGHLSAMARSGRLSIFKGRYQVAYADRSFGTHDQAVLIEAASRGSGRPVTVKHLESGEVIHYPSASQFINETGLSKKAITVRLKRDGEEGRISHYAGFQFAYADLELITPAQYGVQSC